MKIWALSSTVSSAFPGTSQLMDWKVCWDQALLSVSVFDVRGLLAACRSHLAKRRVTVSPLIVRLASEAGMSGAILEGAAQQSRQSVARAPVWTLI